jgi:hypothetical protein
MADVWSLRQHSGEVRECAEEGCTRPAYDGTWCKFHADLAAYRESGSDPSPVAKPPKATGAKRRDRR